ncbi:MAG: hypothetical protein Q8M44_05910, partial [bacterium]|nr:hypothetical protein [bacterium]
SVRDDVWYVVFQKCFTLILTLVLLVFTGINNLTGLEKFNFIQFIQNFTFHTSSSLVLIDKGNVFKLLAQTEVTSKLVQLELVI